MAARLRALDALELVCQGYTYAAIARQLGYRHRASAYNAVHRLTDEAAAWHNFTERTGYRVRRQPTQAELSRALADLEAELAARLDGQPARDAEARLRRLLVSRDKAERRRAASRS